MKTCLALAAVLIVFAITKAELEDGAINSDDPTRITNGYNSTRGQFPYHVVIWANYPEDEGVYLCGGALFSDRWILTAAECVQHIEFLEIHFGAHHLLDDDSEDAGRVVQRVWPNNTFPHPLYIVGEALNNVALIQLDVPVAFSDIIAPVQLVSENEWHYDSPAAVSGFGVFDSNAQDFPEVLQWAPYRTINNLLCAKDHSLKWATTILRREIICAVGAGAASACFGDFGNPLVTQSGVLIGIQNGFSEDDCRTVRPTVFTRVSSLLSWIEEVARP